MKRNCPNWRNHTTPDFLPADEVALEECDSCRKRRHPSGLSHHVVAELQRMGWDLVPAEPPHHYEGTFPIAAQRVPAPGIPCVYRLYDAAGNLSYVGRSETVRNRLVQHWQTPKKKPYLSTWQVQVCSTVEHMVELEAAQIREGMPYLNATTEVRSCRP